MSGLVLLLQVQSTQLRGVQVIWVGCCSGMRATRGTSAISESPRRSNPMHLDSPAYLAPQTTRLPRCRRCTRGVLP
ncbi:hypothetical protein B0H10DRAFT_2123102 [Mycena sp. CBHHK59/15]|nr:hypothetical protein B0H10DRAFT_2123102 [Mycena sp. CBHHK59/15]